MTVLSRVRSAWRNLVRRNRVERDLHDELQSTFDMLVDEKLRAGLTPSQARRAVTIELGGIEPVKERVRDIRTGASVDAFVQDLRYAVRHLRRSLAFAVGFAAGVVPARLAAARTRQFVEPGAAIVFRRLPAG